MKTALIIYWSSTKNTEKVALSIYEGLKNAGVQVTMIHPKEAETIDYFDYDLVCIGSPSIQWHPAKPIDDFLINKLATYRKQGKIRLCAPKINGKYALIFCTYSGPHTGLDEATPAGKYIRQFFEHIGFTVIDEWYIVSEFHGSEENSTKGKLGDIRGKPTVADLLKIKEDAKQLAQRY
jgi:flavodoxin